MVKTATAQREMVSISMRRGGMKKYSNLVKGKLVSPLRGKYFKNINIFLWFVSGNIDFHKNFSSVEFAPIKLKNNKLSFEIIADQSIVEVFADGGSVVISDQVFPESEENRMQLVVNNGTAKLRELEIFIIR